MIKAYMKALYRLLAFCCISFYLFTPSAIIFAASPPPTCQLHLNTTTISIGGSVTLSWTSTNATGGAITNVGNVGPTGSINLLPSSAQYTTYVGSFTGPGGTANCSATVQVSAGGGSTSGPTDTTGGGTSNSIGNAGAINGLTSSSGGKSGTPTGLVPCGVGIFTPDNNGSTSCNACSLVQLVQNIIFFVIGLSFPLFAALFAYAGVLYFTSGAKPANKDKAKGVFKNAFVGFLIAITAWLVVNTVLSVIFSQSGFAKNNWFGGYTCSNDQSVRPTTGSIGDVLNKVLGTAPAVSSVSTGGVPTPGSAAYTAAQQQTAIDSVYYTLYSACSAGDTASCTAYQALPDPSTATLAQVVQASTAQLQALCDGGDKASCDAYLAMYNPTTITPDSSLFTSGNGSGGTGGGAAAGSCGSTSCTAVGTGSTVTYLNPDGTTQTNTGGSVAWRNNNPGNMIAGAGGITPVGYNNGFAVFATYQDGYNAMIDNLQTNRYQSQTIAGAISTWAPAAGGNDPVAYAQSITQQTGLPSNTPMSSLTTTQLTSVANAIQKYEGYTAGTVAN